MKEAIVELSNKELQERILNMKPIYSGRCIKCKEEIMLPDKYSIGICLKCNSKEGN